MLVFSLVSALHQLHSVFLLALSLIHATYTRIREISTYMHCQAQISVDLNRFECFQLITKVDIREVYNSPCYIEKQRF